MSFARRARPGRKQVRQPARLASHRQRRGLCAGVVPRQHGAWRAGRWWTVRWRNVGRAGVGRRVVAIRACRRKPLCQLDAEFIPHAVGLGLHHTQAESAQPAQYIDLDLHAQRGLAAGSFRQKYFTDLLERAGDRGVFAGAFAAQVMWRAGFDNRRPELEARADESNLHMHLGQVFGVAHDLDGLHARHAGTYHHRVEQHGPDLRRRRGQGQQLFNFHSSAPRPP